MARTDQLLGVYATQHTKESRRGAVQMTPVGEEGTKVMFNPWGAGKGGWVNERCAWLLTCR